MDVSNLVPTPANSNATGAAPARARTEREPFDAAAAAATRVTPEVPVPPRPVKGAGGVSDRIERSSELQRSIVELKLELAQLPDPSGEQVDELRSELADPQGASLASREAAANGILRGER